MCAQTFVGEASVHDCVGLDSEEADDVPVVVVVVFVSVASFVDVVVVVSLELPLAAGGPIRSTRNASTLLPSS